MNPYACLFPPPNPDSVYRVWYGTLENPVLYEVTFKREPNKLIATTARRLIPGGRITGIQRVIAA